MQVEDRLWQRMYDAKRYDYYLCELIRVKRICIRNWNIVIASVSTSGIMGWKIWDSYPIVACIIVSVISLIKLNEQNIIPNEKQIEKLIKAMNFYSDFYIKAEKLWFDLQKNRITEEETIKGLHKLEKSEKDIDQVINEVHRKVNSKCDKKAENKADSFFNSLNN